MKNKTIFSFVLIMILSIFSSLTVYAAEVEIISQKLNLYISEDLKKDVYMPGDFDNLKFVVENKTNNTIKVKKLYLSKNDDALNESFEELARYTNVVIKNQDSVVAEGLLIDILDKNNVNLNIELGPKESLEFDMSIDISIDMGNKAQNCYQELYLNADYEVHGDDNIIDDNNQGNPGNNRSNDDNSQAVGGGSLPQTGTLYDSMTIVILIGIALLFMYRKEIVKIIS